MRLDRAALLLPPWLSCSCSQPKLSKAKRSVYTSSGLQYQSVFEFVQNSASVSLPIWDTERKGRNKRWVLAVSKGCGPMLFLVLCCSGLNVLQLATAPRPPIQLQLSGAEKEGKNPCGQSPSEHGFIYCSIPLIGVSSFRYLLLLEALKACFSGSNNSNG